MKFKKLAGGGYFKIINQHRARRRCKTLGYDESPARSPEIIDYAVGNGTLKERAWRQS